MIKDMNLANRITLARIVFIPVFLVVLLGQFPEWLTAPRWWLIAQPWLAAIIFVALAASTLSAVAMRVAKSAGRSRGARERATAWSVGGAGVSATAAACAERGRASGRSAAISARVRPAKSARS